MAARKLQIERVENESDPTKTVLRLKGVIDEDADLQSTFSKLKGQTVLDLEGIEMINSAGVRAWTNAVAKLSSQIQILLEKCSPRIVEQLNYVSSFLGRCRVVSFFAPYFCPKCKTEAIQLLQVEEVRKKNIPKPPHQKCPRCKSPMEFDDVAVEYFAFLN